MVKFAMSVVSFALFTVLSLPVLAQDAPAKAAVATVQIDGGVVMVSDGGPFTSATSGEQVVAGSRIMISKDSSAKLVYSDGCMQSYTKAGVYAVNEQCKAAAAIGTAGNAGNGWTTAAVVIGAAGAAGVAYGIYCDSGSHCSGSSPSH